MSIKKILVTGANGQLGWELSQLASAYPNYELVMVDRSVLDLSKPESYSFLKTKYGSFDLIIDDASHKFNDMVFSFDSIITAGGTAKRIEIMIALKGCIAPVRTSSSNPPIAFGKPAAIPPKIMIEMPLPMR